MNHGQTLIEIHIYIYIYIYIYIQWTLLYRTIVIASSGKCSKLGQIKRKIQKKKLSQTFKPMKKSQNFLNTSRIYT